MCGRCRTGTGARKRRNAKLQRRRGEKRGNPVLSRLRPCSKSDKPSEQGCSKYCRLHAQNVIGSCSKCWRGCSKYDQHKLKKERRKLFLKELRRSLRSRLRSEEISPSAF